MLESNVTESDGAVEQKPYLTSQVCKLRIGKALRLVNAIETGKIQAGEMGLSGLRRQLESALGIDVDLSVIRRGGPFNQPPFIGVSGE